MKIIRYAALGLAVMALSAGSTVATAYYAPELLPQGEQGLTGKQGMQGQIGADGARGKDAINVPIVPEAEEASTPVPAATPTAADNREAQRCQNLLRKSRTSLPQHAENAYDEWIRVCN